MCQMCHGQKGVVEHLLACLLVSVVTVEVINDEKHLTRMVLLSLTTRNLGMLHQLRK